MTRADTIGREHIGREITIHPRTDEGTLDITGVVRWLRMDTDTLIVAVEEDDESGAVEWTLRLRDEVTVR